MAQKNVSKGGQDDDDGDDDDVQELDSDVEIVICQLWDMTTEQVLRRY